jgi:16S rRNA A1518/A1519 N6-dimethyltransferase RsmA/KsgA/DIM1 with predicted DNA glycosylase/AP lyase activity
MPIQLDPEEHEISAFLELAPNLQHARVVEVGCGDGRLTRRYAAHAASVLAFDPDEAAIARLRADPPPGAIDICAGALESVEVQKGSADVVLLSWAL